MTMALQMISMTQRFGLLPTTGADLDSSVCWGLGSAVALCAVFFTILCSLNTEQFTPMALLSILLLLIAQFSVVIVCSVQDEWIALKSPDFSSNLQAGTPYTLKWTKDLQIQVPTSCASCSIAQVDLWVTIFFDKAHTHLIVCI
jgi:hypothetical protein